MVKTIGLIPDIFGTTIESLRKGGTMQMSFERKSLGEKLRKLRESLNLSQGQVAKALNIDRSTYTNYELDKTRPNLETLVKLAHIYNVPKAYLLPEDDGERVAVKDIARADSMLRTLSKEERGLIAIYRSLGSEERAQLVKELSRLTKKNAE